MIGVAAVMVGGAADEAVDGQACRLACLCVYVQMCEGIVLSVVPVGELGVEWRGAYIRAMGLHTTQKEASQRQKLCGLVKCPTWTRLGVIAVALSP